MFDFGVGYTEMFLIAVVAIIVIGPKDLPRVLRAFGKTMAKMRGMAREFQGHLDGAMRDAGLDDVKKDLQSLKNIGTIDPAPKSAAVAVPAKKPENDFGKYFGDAADAKPASDAA
ncbi:MAG: twin-arginine translocase subunit TatB [Rhizobiales bacterium]|nr:twin-arginine translocase subunit TatB [Hyphomicrobiales bacterium]